MALIAVREGVPLAPLTTLGLGGPARHFVDCTSLDDLRDALAFARERDLHVQILGGGSNTIFPDAGYPGVVVRIALHGTQFENDASSTVVTAAAGEPWDALVAESVRRELSGIECLSGIPGLVGATPIQNVGAYGQEIADTLVAVRCLDRTADREVTLAPAECGFGYRSSRFKRADRDRFVILDVTLRLARDARPTLRYAELAQAVDQAGGLANVDPAAAIRRTREAVLALRRRKSMVIDPADPESRSAGSFFLNPVIPAETYDRLVSLRLERGETPPPPAYPAEGGVKLSAAWLVEQAGFAKGHRHGGVAVSKHHALALVNHSGTTAELLALAHRIQDAVQTRFGIRLEREPVLAE